MTLQDQIRQRWGQYGDWAAAGQDQVDALARLLQSNGVNNLDNFRLQAREYTTPERQMRYGGDAEEVFTMPGESGTTFDAFNGDQQLGFLGDINSDGSYTSRNRDVDGVGKLQGGSNLLGWSSAGHGNTSFKVAKGPNGEPVVVPVWGSSSQQTYDDLRGIASILTLAAGGYYARAGGATGAVANGALQGYGTAVAGNMIANPDGDVNSLAKSGLTGAAAGALSGGIKAYGADQGWNPATTRAVQGGANAALRGGDGGDILKGAALSGAQSYFGGGAGSQVNQGADIGGKAMDFNFDPNWDYSGGGGNFDLTGWNAGGADNGSFDFSGLNMDGNYGLNFSDTSLADYLANNGQGNGIWKSIANAFSKDGNGGGGLGSLLPMLLGAGMGAMGGKDQQQTNSRAPWEPMQPYLKALAQEGADLYAKYKAQPFSQAQQNAYGNIGGLLDLVNANAGGLLSGFQANADGRNQFRRGQQNTLIGSSFNPTAAQWQPGLLGNFGTKG